MCHNIHCVCCCHIERYATTDRYICLADLGQINVDDKVWRCGEQALINKEGRRKEGRPCPPIISLTSAQ